MLKYRKAIVYIFILYFIWGVCYISEADAQQKSYKRIFPGSVSPEPSEIQVRDSRETMEQEVAEEEQVSEAEKETKPTGERPKRTVGEATEVYYRIAVDDKLYISVWRVGDLSLEVIVGPDGYISYPLIGDIQASGRTLSELDGEITGKLKKYVINPQVSVTVRAFAGDQVVVIGEVKSPGIYKFIGKTRLMNIIALAGGVTDRAKLGNLVIVRESDNPEQKDENLLLVDIKSVLKGNLENNVEVKANDIIYVSRTFVSNVKEFYDDWITPAINDILDYESYKSIRRDRHR